MEKIRVLDVNRKEDYKLWNQIIEQYFNDEIMLKASYYKLFSDSENQGMAVLYACNSGIIFYPFIKRQIPDYISHFDIISAYGYGGPYGSTGITSCHWINFWLYFDEWCHNNKIVSEVIKFGLFGNENCYYPGQIETVMNNIVRNLEINLDDLNREYEHKVRKNVKRAEQYKLSFELDIGEKRIDKFLNIYYDTMDRRNAEQKYYFDKNFFEWIRLEMYQNSCIFFVSYEGIPVSTELVLTSKENIYSYLGGTNPDYFQMRPNDFLKTKVIQWGHNNGYKNYILGGGYKKEDGIYRYKKAFAPGGIKEFKIGSRILDEVTYKNICLQKDIDYSIHYIPAYRTNNHNERNR